MSKEVCLFGAGGHGKVIMEIVIKNNSEIIAFIDDNNSQKEQHKVPVVGSHELKKYKEKSFIISIGSNRARKKISENHLLNYITIVDSSAIISCTSSFGVGTVVMPSVVVNAGAKIGDHVILNTSCVIEHDCIIEDFVHISPNATLTGGVTVGKGTHVGAGAVIIPGVTIGKWATIGAGSVILKDVPDYATVVGNPGKIIKKNENSF